MKFCRLIKYDIKNGILTQWYRFFIAMLLSCAVISAYAVLCRDQAPTLINLLFYLFAGKEPLQKDLNNAFEFPVVWLGIYMFCMYMTLEYPFENLDGHGKSVIIRIRSRACWWTSKCVWVAICTILYFAMLYVGVFIAALINSVDFTFEYSESANYYHLSMVLIKQMTHSDMLLQLVVIPVLTAITINMIMLFLELFLDRMYCFWGVALYLFAATYFKNPFLVGNYAMMKKSEFCITGTCPISLEIIIEMCIIIVCIIAGTVKINRYDILNKESL